MSSISFTANYIAPANVLKKGYDAYEPFAASFVEFDPNCANDREALFQISEDWNSRLVSEIYDKFTLSPDKDLHVYGAVAQTDTFEKLRPENMLGVIKIEDYPNYGTCEITQLQVNPRDIFRDKIQMSKPEDRLYKKIETAILDNIKKIFENRMIELYPAEDAVGFYLENGFRFTDEYELAMRYFKNILKK